MMFAARYTAKYTIIFVFCVGLITGCDKIEKPFSKRNTTKNIQQVQVTPAVKGMVIAKVNNIPITLEELNKEVDIFNASLDLREDLTPEQKKEAKIDTREKKINYLKNYLVRQMVFYQLALDKGLDKKETIQEILNRYKIAILASEMQAEIIKNIEVGSAEVEEAYKNNKDLFKEPESRKVREIVTKTEDEAKQILVSLMQGADFAVVARERSVAESAKNGGDLGFIKRGQRGEKYRIFDDVAFSPALQEGSLSGVFKSPDGFYVVKIEGIKGGKQVSLSEAWDTLKSLLLASKQQQELNKAYSDLSRNTKIEIYEGEIK
ncbi:MAG: peptidyl-prolyl cis-trans isomerase [Candidatus Omnitrophica bacterium]|nr:peptidyl-prolyl cis-trans isomerase [Candidatus Omnitrophota bacterium]